MNLARVEQIANAVLYEGYMLYPYRPSSVKNRQRWNFGVLYPKQYSEAQEGTDPCSMQTQCLIMGSDETIVEGRLRFLQLQTRSSSSSTTSASASLPNGWQEAAERDINWRGGSLGDLYRRNSRREFSLPQHVQIDSEETTGTANIERRQEAIRGTIEVSVKRFRPDLFRMTVHVQNVTPLFSFADRDAALMRSLVSTHLILGVTGGDFISLLEPPESLQVVAQDCQNVGVWPVLVGDPGERTTLLASPIILYDYPQIAPESVGDLFDGTEIDEILSLRIMTLTDEEKQEIRQSDARARQILERTDAMPAEQFMKLHGAVRGLRPLKEDAS